MLGQTVTVTVDRPLGSRHPDHPAIWYPVNYGYVEGILAPDGEEQDAYILGIDRPLARFAGKVAAIIHRRDDPEDKWVVVPENAVFSEEDIARLTRFQEQYFDTYIEMEPRRTISSPGL